MKPEQQRITIAEACGWTKISDWKAAGINGQHPTEPWTEVIPDYLHDLNAMHKAEKWLIEDDQHAYGCYCIDLQEEYGNTVHLTAAQRAEAFLRTIGKWTTNQNEL
jgi:hypothetical protein